MKYIKATLFYVAVVILLPFMALVFAGQAVFNTLEELGTEMAKLFKKLLMDSHPEKEPEPVHEPDPTDQRVFEPGMGVPIDIVRDWLDNADMQKMTDREHTDLRKLMNDTMLKSLEVQFCSFVPQEEKGGAA